MSDDGQPSSFVTGSSETLSDFVVHSNDNYAAVTTRIETSQDDFLKVLSRFQRNRYALLIGTQICSAEF
jgi:hypothetical protein